MEIKEREKEYMINEAYKELATAIVFRAVRDAAKMKEDSKGYDTLNKFLHSQWCELLSGVDYSRLSEIIERYKKETNKCQRKTH